MLRIEREGRPITSLADWERFTGPKSPEQWKEHRSAYELARAWCGGPSPTMPAELRRLLESRPETSGLQVETVCPECRIRFDKRRGEPRNADLAFVGRNHEGVVAVTIEAKADEPFGPTVGEALAGALERRVANPRSRAVERVVDLVSALCRPGDKDVPLIADLHYQLLTAAAGTLAYAAAEHASVALLVMHEFRTQRTSDDKLALNERAYRRFLARLGNVDSPERVAGAIHGPFSVPGTPLFPPGAALLIGKIRTDCKHFA